MASSVVNSPELSLSPKLEDLHPQFILGEMLEHLGQLGPFHPTIDLGVLQEWLEIVRNDQVDLELTVRKLLKAFSGTQAFKERFDPLDEFVKSKIKAFADGKSAKDVVAGTGFEPKPSPSSQHRFHELKYSRPKPGSKSVSTSKPTTPRKSTSSRFWTKFSNWFGRLVQKYETHVSQFSVPDDLEQRKRLFSQVWGDEIVYEDEQQTKVMEVYRNVEFENWGLVDEVKNTPAITCVPTKVLGLQNLVKYAISHKKRIRCAGYRHSWAPIFSQQGQILVSMINLQEATQLPDPLVLLPDSASNVYNDFKTIQVVFEGSDLARVRLGAAVTTEEFRRWAVKDGKWTLPLDVILGEVTIGGTNGSICHGAGHGHQTLNDQVRAIEYVDVNGIHQKITDSTHLKAAAGCFGLLGIVTYITYELNPMTYANMQPKKMDINLAIPPPSPSNVPAALRKPTPVTQQQLDSAVADFERRATSDYYAEWFWFAYQSKAWVNTWPTPTADPAGSRDYTSPAETFLQWTQTWLGGVITATTFYQALPGRWQAQLLAAATMAAMPSDVVIKTALPNALHFRRDDQNMRVRDIELEIPLTEKPDGTGGSDGSGGGGGGIDWMPVRRAWWDVIELVYSELDSPLRLCMELRIMADSEIIMAPQRGNRWGTASIEVLTIPDAVADDEWARFLQKVVDRWMAGGGNVRPHWGKEWATPAITMREMPAPEYLKRVAYKDAIPEFRQILGDIGKVQGWGLDKLRERFSNELWDEMIFDS